MEFKELDTLCHKIAGKFYRKSYLLRALNNYDDLVQECHLVAIKARPNFKGINGASLKTFLHSAMENHIKSLMRHQYSKQHHVFYTESPESKGFTKRNTNESLMLHKLYEACLIYQPGQRRHTKDKYLALAKLLHEGYSRVEIAQKWGTTRQMVDRLIRVLKNKVSLIWEVKR